MRWKSIILAILTWLLVLTYLVVTLSFISNRAQQVVCSKIAVNISDSLQNAFVTKNDVMKTIVKYHKNLIGIPLWMINTYELEQSIRKIQMVKRADVYTKVDGSLTVDIKQRNPMVRIIFQNGHGYYIDYDGHILPLSSKFTPHVLIVNGNIPEPSNIKPGDNISDWVEASGSEKIPLICQLYDFANFITEDDFWKAQISQVYVVNSSQIELIPRVGAHTILLGSLDDYENKLKKLMIFYETALPHEGWNKYKLINLKFRNQIVCTKK
jgi:cell division protein FtsQ